MKDYIQEVYEKYNHLDSLLCDERWLSGADFKYHIMRDLWLAVKSTIQKRREREAIMEDIEHG